MSFFRAVPTTLVHRRLAALLIVVLTVSLSGCGTLFYPERKGQPQGRVDPGVAIADGLGLLLFIVPGVIAYAIDFSNNTIYLPGSQEASLQRLPVEDAHDEKQLAALIDARVGGGLDWHRETVRVIQPATREQALAVVRDQRLDGDS